MENMDNGLTLSKWVLKNWLKVPQMPQKLPNLPDQSQKFWISIKKGLHWVAVVHVVNYSLYATFVTHLIVTVILKTNKIK
jgi:hypothetical protein